MSEDNYPIIDEVRIDCPRCREVTTYYIEENRAICQQCGRLQDAETAIKEAEEKADLDNQNSFEQAYKW